MPKLQLLSYTLHRHSAIRDGFDLATESGYSVFLFSEHPSDYCIFNEFKDFSTLRILLCIAFGVLEVIVLIFVSLLIASTYRTLKENMESSVTWKYFFGHIFVCLQWTCYLDWLDAYPIFGCYVSISIFIRGLSDFSNSRCYFSLLCHEAYSTFRRQLLQHQFLRIWEN